LHIDEKTSTADIGSKLGMGDCGEEETEDKNALFVFFAFFLCAQQ